MNSPYVVVTTQRSGSTWLMDLINGMPNAVGQGELFLRRQSESTTQWDAAFAYPRYADVRRGIRPFSTWRYLNGFYRQDGHTGFKLMYSQLRTIPEIWAYIQTRRIPVVHLVRRNFLDTLISSRTKTQLGRAHYLVGDQVPSDFTVHIEPDDVIDSLARLRKQQTVARRVLAYSFTPVLEVAYEDLLDDPSRFETVWRFLRIDSIGETPESRLQRVQKRPHAEVIRDSDAVRSVILGSEFADLWR